MEYLNNLNEDQKQVVLYNDGPMVVMSGAGSGKTHTLVTKVRYLLEQGVPAKKIVVVTLTKKAAEELQDRLRVAVGSDLVEELQVSTIHSFAYRIYKKLRKSVAPYEMLPKILFNDFEPFLMLLAKAKENNLANKDVMGHLGEIGWHKTRLMRLEQYKAETDLAEQKASEDGEDGLMRHEIAFRRSVESTWKEYDKYLKKKNKMDFTDILLNCHDELTNLEHKKTVERISKQIEYLIVDEAQDTTMLSFKILEILSKYNNRMILIGDLKQSIYSFAGAEIKNVIEFINKYNPKVFDLKINYRSTQNIVDNANKFVSGKHNMLGAPSTTNNSVGDLIIRKRSMDEQEEAHWVLDQVEKLLSQGTEPREIAIIYRVHSLVRSIEDQFVMSGIPYITYSETGFYQRKETKDILTYLKIMIDPQNYNVTHLKRIANKPTRYIKNDTLDDIEYFALQNDFSLTQAMAEFDSGNYGQDKSVKKLQEELRAGSRMVNSGCTTIELIDYILKSIGYEKWANENFKDKEADVDVLMNLDAVISSAKNWPKPEEFLKFIREIEQEEEKKKDETGNYVQLMTIHKSKGKEFKHVFVVSICDRCYPFHKADTAEQMDEEARIMYVAITRPKQHLYISEIVGKLGRFSVYPSKYLSEMKTSLFQDFEMNWGGQTRSEYRDNFFKQLTEAIK